MSNDRDEKRMPPTGRKAEQAAASRQALVASARALFEAKGYAASSTEEVLQSTGLTRGALYHHFRDKRALFEAVCDQIHGELVDAIERATLGIEDPRQSLRRGARAWLEAASAPARARVLLVDAPAVLGAAGWREIDERHGFAALREAVRRLRGDGGKGHRHDDGVRSRGRDDARAVALNGAINELATWVAGDTARMKPALSTLDLLIDAIAAQG